MDIVVILWAAVGVLALLIIGALALIWRQDQEIDRLRSQIEQITDGDHRART